jgi:hypothetical protein
MQLALAVLKSSTEGNGELSVMIIGIEIMLQLYAVNLVI